MAYHALQAPEGKGLEQRILEAGALFRGEDGMLPLLNSGIS